MNFSQRLVHVRLKKVHQRSIDKKEFSHHKAEFLDAVLMQREYWAKKDIKLKNNDFFGYSLK